MSNYDSRPDTYEHIQTVQRLINRVIRNLLGRSEEHDYSKLHDPEVSVFDEYTPKLKDSTYGSDEYKEFLKGMGEGLQHHYKNNSHHPEYYKDGIRGMNLMDLMEMVCDWKAATMRHSDGDIIRSLQVNQERFGYSDELKQILINTVHDLYLHNEDIIGHKDRRRA